MPATGTPSRTPARTGPYSCDDDLISGSIDSGMPISPAISESHDSVDRSISMVRLAFVTSVTCTPPLSAPPVRFHRTQVSMLPNTRSPASAFARAPSTLSRIHRTLGPEKYVASGRPTLALYRSAPPPRAARSSQIFCVRVSCQTIALCTGWPVVLSHTTAVSRWLVMPTAATSDGDALPLASAPLMTSRVLFQTSLGLCSTHPARG